MSDPEQPSDTVSSPMREVRYEHTPNFPTILHENRLCLLVSTYQAGKLISVGSLNGSLAITFHDFEQVMGVAYSQKNGLAIGTRRKVEFLIPAREVAEQIEPPGTFDACWLSRTSFTTGSIHVHDLAWGTDGVWAVNTLFSCLCTLSSESNFVPRWRPPFISQLIDQDRCHLNGLAMESGKPRYVSVLGETDDPAGWRANKVSGGAILDVRSGQVITRGLSMPHSPRTYDRELVVLNSGLGHLSRVNRSTGHVEPIASLPGYTRGLSLHKGLAFVGLSKIRETNIFGGLPISESNEALRCGIGIVELATGRTVATLQFHSGVEEIFAVEVVPEVTNPHLCGPSLNEKTAEIWIVPSDSADRKIIDDVDETNDLSHLMERPGDCSLAIENALEAHSRNDLQLALRWYRYAHQLNPKSASLLTNLGNLHQDLGDSAAAVDCYLQAIEIDPSNSPAQQNLGMIYSAQNQPLRALHHFELAQASHPQAINFVLGAKVLPVIYDSVEQVQYWRQRVTDRVHDLAESGVVIDTADGTIPTSFFLAYQGANDREIMQDLARVYRSVECCEPAASKDKRPLGRRLRVGFMSAHFCNHTIGRLNLGVVQRLSRKDFDVTVIALRSHNDRYSNEFRQSADHYVEVPRAPAAARNAIAELGLDILIFADVGMDTLTQTLCYSRMAPIQAATWGHPDTTGSPAIDYFISSELAEPSGAETHYSERLERLPTLGIHYHRPQRTGPARDKNYFGLDNDRRVYLCPQTLFKFHPGFDDVLRRILEQDPLGDLVIIEGRNPHWVQSLLDRWQRCFPNSCKQVKFIPSQSHDDFLQLLSVADVMLDPFPFCGGNTTYEALAMGTPAVTLPGEFLRGRLSLAMYRRMQLDAPVARTQDEYVQLANRIALERDYRETLQKTIDGTSSILFDNHDDVTHFENMLARWYGR